MSPAMLESASSPTCDRGALTFPVWPRVPDEVVAAVTTALQAARYDPSLLSALNGGGPVGEFEAAFAEFIDVQHALAVNSGASALHLALLAAGVGPGDEVILPAYGWGQILVFLDALDAVPVFVDIEPSTLGLDPASVAERLTERTRAIVVTHFAGLPADVEALLPLAEQVGAVVIEDCAQALGARRNGRVVGTIGHLGVFSFGPRKHLPCGEGGSLVTNDPLLWQRAIIAGQHPDRAALQVSDPRLCSTELFWPYRMHPLAAVMGLSLLPFLPVWAKKRAHDHILLCSELEKATLVELLRPVAGSNGAWSGMALVFQPNDSNITRQKFVQHLREQGVPLTDGPVRTPLHRRVEVTVRWGEQIACPVTQEYCAEAELMLRETIGLIDNDNTLVGQIAAAFQILR